MLHATEWNQLRIGKNDRALLIGATGTGKTTLARFLIEDDAKPYSVTYDPKISESISKWRTSQTFLSDFSIVQESDAKRIVYRPSVYESLNPDAQDAFFAWIYQRCYTRCYVDEAYSILGGTNPSFHLQAILSRGRERGISTIIATQRPKRIPLITLSEAEHVFIFRLNLAEDKLRVEELTGIPAEEVNTLRNYEFFYYNALLGDYTNKLKLTGI